MITASLGSHRFESGPTYHFNGSHFEDLRDVVLDPTGTVEYVNALPKVDATPQEIREVAASGIVRLSLQGLGKLDQLELARDTLLDVCSGDSMDGESFADRWRWKTDFYGSGLVNHVLDSASVLATRKNRPEETAGIITEQAPTDEGYFVIGIANGGIISAARTYLSLGEGNNSLGAVKYSRRKNSDTKPNMYPSQDLRINWFMREAEDRQVVVIDEDYGTGTTLMTATYFFADLLKTKVVGIAPVQIDRRITFDPLVIKSK